MHFETISTRSPATSKWLDVQQPFVGSWEGGVGFILGVLGLVCQAIHSEIQGIFIQSLYFAVFIQFFFVILQKKKFLISSVVTSSQYSWLECAIFELPDLDPVFLGSSTAWMLGSTPPSAKVTWDKSWLSSSSFRTANCKWRGMIRDFLLSRAAFPASSSTSAVRYSNTAARYTGAPLPTRSE